MSEANAAAKFLLAGDEPTSVALDRIACWDELTEPGGGWAALDEALQIEKAKLQPRPRVLEALGKARRFAGDGTHPANIVSRGGAVEWRACA